MRFFGKTFFILAFVITFLTLLFSLSIKFQLLNADYILKSFRDSDVYPKLTTAIKKAITEQTEKEGGSISETEFIVEIVNENLLRDFIEKNLPEVIGFMNGKIPDPTVYLPISTLPSSLIPKNLAIKEYTKLSEIPSYFPGMSEGFDADPTFGAIGKTGFVASQVFLTILIILLILTIMIYRLTTPGEKFKHLGITLIFSSILALLLSGFITIARVILSQDLLLPDKEAIQMLIGTLLPPLISGMTNLWVVISLATLLAGIVLLFIKKPALKK